MSKIVKVCLALFLSLAVIAQYSFTPQAMVAYGTEEGTVTAAEESDGDSGESSEQKASSSTQETTHATEAPASTQAPAATTESTQATESTEATTVPEEQSDDVEDENDVNTGDPIAGEDPAAEEEEAAEEDTDEEWERSFSGSCNGLTVKVSAPEGAFKKGTEMNLSAISDATAASIVSSVLPEDKEVADVVGVDISFSYKGSKDQPNESVKVSISGANLEGSNPVLYHKHGGAVEQSGASNNGASITTGAFSPFVLATSADGEEEMWTVNFRNRDGDIESSKKVADNAPIGEMPNPEAREDYTAYWTIGTHSDEGQGSWNPGKKVDSNTIVTSDLDLVPGYTKIEHTITFWSEDLSEVIATKTVDVDTSYCLNDIPAVPQKSGCTGKWVYSDGDFNNSVKVENDMDVWAEYEENVFTVTYKYTIDGKETTYQEDTYYKGDALEIASDPVVEGRTFDGWYIGETKYTGGEPVNADMELQGKFNDMVSVQFVVLNDDGTVKETLAQYFRDEEETIGVMPENPFVAGKTFDKWVREGTDEEVTKDTVVDESFRAIAQFKPINVYTLEVDYYYLKDNGQERVFSKEIEDLDESDFDSDDSSYEIIAPASTQTDPEDVAGGPVYYPETPTVKVKLSDFNNFKHTVRIKYVKYTAEYDFVYKLKDLTGTGYTEIDRVHVQGVLGSYVTPTVKSYDYAVLESATGAEITQAEGQELEVKYTRKNYQLSYETNGGSYIPGTTAAYGQTVSLSNARPTKTGYTFDGWYLDESLNTPAGSSIKIEKDTTIYAKWKGANVNYTIVYQFEKYNDAGTSSKYEYDNSRNATGTVGSTVQASSAPIITRAGWEVDTAKNATSTVVIEADGSSVLYVYYKLTEYTFQFRPGTFSSGWTTYNVTAPLNGQSRTGNNNYSYTFKAKLGQDISSLWLSAGNGTYRSISGRTHNVNFSGWQKASGGSIYVTKRLILTSDMLPTSGTTVTYQGHWLEDTAEYTVNYWLQNANDDGYTKSNKYSQTFNYAPGGANLGAKEIAGYTYDSRKDDHKWTGGWNSYIYEYNFYYDRDVFKIDYYYGSTKLNTINNVKFDANINNGTYNWTPTARQCGVDSDYTFNGWYSDSGLTTPYTFSTMPASNLVLYAKWTAPEYTVTYEMDGGTPQIESVTVPKYSKVTRPSDPTKKGFTFDGWFTSADGNTLYDWATQITKDTTIYAHWTQDPLSYTVHYVDKDGAKVAEDKVVTNPNFEVGQQITEQAVAIVGLRPDEGSKNITLKLGKNEITFVYSAKAEKVKYSVKYVLEDFRDIEVAKADPPNPREVDGDTLSVIELAAPVDYDMLYHEHPEFEGEEFFPDEAEKTLTLGTDESSNVITFYYSKYQSAKVTINFVDMEGNQIHDPDVQILKVGKTLALNRTPIPEWEVNKVVVGTDYDGEEAQPSYKITQGGNMEFTLFYQKKATITANSFSQPYSGEALKLPAALADQVTVEGLLDGDQLQSVEYTYADADNDTDDGRINAGIATVTPKNAVISGHTNENYYKVRYISGTLEVTKINVTVRIEPDRWVGASYNGNPYKTGFTNPTKDEADYILISHEGYAAEYLDDIWNSVKAKATHDETAPGLHYYMIAETNAGEYTYNIDQITLPEDENYSVSLYVRPGRLQILPKEVTVTTGSATKTYDGTPLTNADASIKTLAAADEGKVTVTATGSQTAIGSSTNSYSINWGEVNSENYKITDNLGTLTVKPIMTIKVTGNNKTTKYNGAPQTLEGYTVTSDTPGFDKSKVVYSGEAVASGTDAGKYKMGLSAEFFSYNDDSVTASFEVADGTLTIAPRDVTVTSASATKVYDGTALTNNGITISGDGFVAGETPAFRVTGSQTAVGSSKNTFDILPNNVQSSAVLDLVTASANGYLASNYNIDKVYGTLTVTQAATPTPTPVPDNDGNNPGGGNPAVAAVNPIPAAAIDDTPAPTTINDEPAPRAATGFWALINLICAILTALLSLIMLIRYFGKRREEDEETGEVTEIKRKGGVKLASIIPAIGAIVAFILTEDMTLPMQMVDKWTVLMVVILAIQALVAFFSRKKEEEEDQEDEGAMA